MRELNSPSAHSGANQTRQITTCAGLTPPLPLWPWGPRGKGDSCRGCCPTPRSGTLQREEERVQRLAFGDPLQRGSLSRSLASAASRTLTW